MTSRASRLRRAAERIERAESDLQRAMLAVRRYEIGLLIEMTADEIIDVTREVHAGGDPSGLLDAVADATARWEAGERPGRGDRSLIEEERRISRKRLDALR